MKTFYTLLLTSLILCVNTSYGDTRTDIKQQKIHKMADATIKRVIADNPDAQSQLANAAGYAVFSNAHVSIILASVGGGSGLVHDNADNSDTYMKMAELGVGLGAGIKDYRFVMIFNNASTLKHFIDKGWSFGGRLDAAAKTSEVGKGAGAEKSSHGIIIYEYTKSGFVLQATIKGNKFWKDKDLNK